MHLSYSTVNIEYDCMSGKSGQILLVANVSHHLEMPAVRSKTWLSEGAITAIERGKCGGIDSKVQDHDSSRAAQQLSKSFMRSLSSSLRLYRSAGDLRVRNDKPSVSQPCNVGLLHSNCPP